MVPEEVSEGGGEEGGSEHASVSTEVSDSVFSKDALLSHIRERKILAFGAQNITKEPNSHSPAVQEVRVSG